MPSGIDPLDLLFSVESSLLPSVIFRGYISHSLLFYRQNNLRGFREFTRIGWELKLGAGGDPRRSSSFVPSGPGWNEALKAVRQYDDRVAVRLLTSAIKKAPKTPSFYVLRGFVLGENHWGSRRLSEASIADFETALKLDPDQLWARMGLGMALEMRRRFVRAKSQFDAASSLAPKWSWPHIFRGVCLWYLADPKAAAEVFAHAAKLDPESSLPLLFSARAKADIRDRSLISDLNKALQRDPHSGFALSWRGRAMFVLQRTPEALSDLKRSIKALPDYDRGYSWLGVSLAEQGKLKEAVPLLRVARRLNPYYPTTLYPLAGALMRLGRWDEGGKIMRESAAVDRSGVWIEHRISMSHPNPACLRSRADLDRYIDKRPKSAWAWAWRGQTDLLLQNYLKALADLNRALELDPKDAWTWLWRGEAHRRLGDYMSARRDFETCLRLDKNISWAHAGKGDCLLAEGRAREALKEIDASLKMQSYCAPAHAFRGRALLALGRAKDAAEAFGNSLEIHPQDKWVMRLRAISLALNEDWHGAHAAFGGVGNSDDDAALEAYLLARRGLRREARAAAMEALRRNKRHSLAHGVLGGRLPGTSVALSSLGQGDPAAAFSTEHLIRVAASAGLPGSVRALRRGDMSAALAAFPDRAKRDSGLYRLRGWLKLASGDALGAIEDASRALDATLDPFDPAALWLRSQAQAALR
ncbi:MAG: tetratricopeptide repeat protein [Elusimicrobiota bacterium]